MVTIQPLSPLDWLMPRSYIRQLLFFRGAPAALADRLQAGLVAAVADMPHLAGAVVDHVDPPGSVALLVGPAAPADATSALFSSQDLADILDYDVLRRAHFPPSALRGAYALFDPEATTPVVTNVGEGEGGENDGRPPPPVFRARLTRLRGGVVLAVAVHHATTDITGLGALLGVWAAHCRGDDGGGDGAAGGFTPAWCDRAPLCVVAPPTSPSRRVPELLFFEDENEKHGTPPPVPRRFPRAPDTPFAAALFAFAAPRLRALRDGVARVATGTAPPPPRVSTSDILMAVLYSAVVDALHGDEAQTAEADDDGVAEISVPVNFRTRGDVPLPAGYLGAAFGRARVRVPVRMLREVVGRFGEEGGYEDEAEEEDSGLKVPLFLFSYRPHLLTPQKQPDPSSPSALAHALAPVALAIRRAITRPFAAGAEPVTSALAYVAGQANVAGLRRRPARALSVVSWADEGVGARVWDAAGTRCEAVRVPGPPGGRNYIIILPRRSDDGGALEVLVCLERTSMARFAGAGALVSGLAAVRWVEDVV